MTRPSAARELFLLLTAKESDANTRIDVNHARLMGALLWAAGGAIVALLLPFAPPTTAIGPAGWAVAACILASTGYVVRRRLDERHELNFGEVFAAGSIALVAIGLLQWLAGPSSPYHYLYVLPVLYVGAVHRRARLLWFLAATVLVVCAPLLYAPRRTSAYGTIAQVVLLLALAGAARIIFVALRSQRDALRTAKRHAERLARVDTLTGLGNRRAFDEALGLEVARALRSGAALSLIVADVDGFKRINDHYGHQRGDEYLRGLGAVLEQTARAGDECFRWGGDEFVLLLPGTARAEAEVVRARLAQATESADALALGSDRLEITFGVAQLGDGETGTDLVAGADAMLLARKRRKPIGPDVPERTVPEALGALTDATEPEQAPPLAFDTPRRRYVDGHLFVAVAFVVLAAFLYLAALLLAGAGLGPALPLVLLTTGAAATALAGWQRDRKAAIAAVETQQRGALRSVRLARKIVRLHAANDPDDIGSLVVRVAVNLLDAQKGVLLTRPEQSGGQLELVGSVGFKTDPSELTLVRRFAERALARDITVRENRFSATDGGSAIRNLVAIPLYSQEIQCGVVICANRAGGFEDLEDGILLSLGDHAASALQNGHLRAAARRSYVATVEMLLDAIRVNDPSLGGHSIEVSTYVGRVADVLGLDAAHRERLIFGSMLHDIGKLGISEQVLLKPEPLTDEERRLVQTHPLIGARLVMQVDALRDLADGILHHHERIDGTGYPDGLPAEEISLDARVIAVVDSFSAMTSDRPYRERLTVEQACIELERNAGTQFDSRVVAAFVDQVRRHPREPPPHPLEVALADPQLAHLCTDEAGALRTAEPHNGHQLGSRAPRH